MVLLADTYKAHASRYFLFQQNKLASSHRLQKQCFQVDKSSQVNKVDIDLPL
jgi:hypothetical protein